MIPVKPKFRLVKYVEKHPNADKLDIVTLDKDAGTFVVEKDTVAMDQGVILFPDGSAISQPLASTLGLPSQNVKKASFRGVKSHGIVVPSDKILRFLSSLILSAEKKKKLEVLNKCIKDYNTEMGVPSSCRIIGPALNLGRITRVLGGFEMELLYSGTQPMIKKAVHIEVHLLDF